MTLQEQLDRIRTRLNDEQEHNRVYHSSDDLVVLLDRVLQEKRQRVATQVQCNKQFQEDVLSFMRAFELMLETVAGASTHGEKACLQRIEKLEAALKSIESSMHGCCTPAMQGIIDRAMERKEHS